MKYTWHAGWLFCGAMLYAIMRYNVFGDVAWVNVPVYVSNKALSWTGLVLFGLSIVMRASADRRGYGTLAAAAISAHVVMSMLVLNPAYFAKFYAASGRMNGVGEASMLAGTAGAVLLAALFTANLQGRHDSTTSLRAGWGRLILWCSATHVLLMGAGWLSPGIWPGYLPPITLVSFLSALGFLYVRGRRVS